LFIVIHKAMKTRHSLPKLSMNSPQGVSKQFVFIFALPRDRGAMGARARWLYRALGLHVISYSLWV
jgi:hypothetical protein